MRPSMEAADVCEERNARALPRPRLARLEGAERSLTALQDSGYRVGFAFEGAMFV